MQKKSIQIANEKGQVAIEFILTFVFALGLTFLFINQVLNMTDGFLTHYANFMASRTYLVVEGANNSEGPGFVEAERAAAEVFNSYPLKDFGVQADFEVHKPSVVGGRAHPVFTGTTATFKKKMSSFSVVGGGSYATLLSESFLGKEPTKYSCYQLVCKAVTGELNGCSSADNMDVTLYDNGC